MATYSGTGVELTGSIRRDTIATTGVDGTLAFATGNYQEFPLPPTDGYKDAWLCLISCFMLEALIWGFPASYGTGIMYLDIPLLYAILKFFPRLRACATPVGLILVRLALGLGSLSTSITHLILTQGIMSCAQ
ncbi:hypothetical protein BKA63DRAFT_572397 [Paraphoma chrysanthemicola]|nr:hypothetical protein BKA63DRAFT_572397 [Paraphoma chrysanthemicola]